MAERILNFSFQPSTTSLRLYGRIEVLRRERKAVVFDILRPERQPVVRDPAHRVIMHFFDNIDVPCWVVLDPTAKTFDGAVFDAGGKQFCIQKRDDEIILQVNSDAPLPPHFDVRVIDALSYVLARSMSWRTLETHSGDNDILYLSSPVRQSVEPQLGRPLAANQWEEQPMFWRLFAKYLDYLSSENNGRSGSSMSAGSMGSCPLLD